MFERVNAPEWELGMSRMVQGRCGLHLGSCRLLPSRHIRVPGQGAEPQRLFSRAGLRSSVRGCMARAEGNTVVPTLVGCLFIDTPEVLDGAWPSTSSETGKPKVIGLYPPQVSGDLISKSKAQDKNAKCGRSVAAGEIGNSRGRCTATVSACRH